MAKCADLGACFVVGSVGVGIPLSDKIKNAGVAIGFKVFYRLGYGCFVGCRNHCVQSRLAQNRCKHFEEIDLRFDVEMAAFLTAVGSPVACHGFVERIEGAELDAVLVLVVLAHIYQILGEFFVEFRTQVVFRRIAVAGHAAAVSHVIRT